MHSLPIFYSSNTDKNQSKEATLVRLLIIAVGRSTGVFRLWLTIIRNSAAFPSEGPIIKCTAMPAFTGIDVIIDSNLLVFFPAN